jgi:hypothetical protein
MKWQYIIQLSEDKTPTRGRQIRGIYYGDFAGAVEQIARAVREEGWVKNTSDVVINLKRGE